MSEVTSQQFDTTEELQAAGIPGTIVTEGEKKSEEKPKAKRRGRPAKVLTPEQQARLAEFKDALDSWIKKIEKKRDEEIQEAKGAWHAAMEKAKKDFEDAKTVIDSDLTGKLDAAKNKFKEEKASAKEQHKKAVNSWKKLFLR